MLLLWLLLRLLLRMLLRLLLRLHLHCVIIVSMKVIFKALQSCKMPLNFFFRKLQAFKTESLFSLVWYMTLPKCTIYVYTFSRLPIWSQTQSIHVDLALLALRPPLKFFWPYSTTLNTWKRDIQQFQNLSIPYNPPTPLKFGCTHLEF